MAGDGLLCLLGFPREFLCRLLPRENKVWGCNADGRPHIPAPHYGAGAWLPPAHLGNNVHFRSTEGVFPSAGASLDQLPEKAVVHRR